MNKVATVLLFINFVTVLFPQPGYIHPDEFFQSTEIVAGDILGVTHVRAWEFNATFPVRNPVFPYLLTGPSLHLLRWMNSTNFVGMKISAVKIVMATRLPMAFISLFGFLATTRLSSHFGADVYLSEVVWCSSYVTWVYFTRTFSNSVEAFLMGLILLIVMNSLSLICVKKNSDKGKQDCKKQKQTGGDQLKEKIQSSNSKDEDKDVVKSQEVEEKVKNKAPDNFTEYHSVGRTACVLGFVVIAGFYNRPTFLLFACVPVAYWFINICFSAKSVVITLLEVILWSGVGIFTAFSLFIATDTLYYNPNFSDIVSVCANKVIEGQYSYQSFVESLELITSSLVITPWNFLKYNMNSDNLGKHGLHPHYTHFLVNLPLLLGPLFFPVLAASLLSLTQLLRGKKSESNNTIWLVLMAFVPIAGLSLFPHQEPRFLIPLLPVLVVLGVKLVSYMGMGKKLFLVLWIIFNVVLNLIYGYMHQAAIIPALSIYQQKLSSPKTMAKLMENGVNHAFFYKTYPPPLHLLLLDPAQSHLTVHDLAGAPVKDLMSEIKIVERERWATRRKSQVVIFLPSTVSGRVTDLLSGYLQEYELKVSTTSICPHLSIENLPRFKQFWMKRLSLDNFVMDFCLNIISILQS